MMLPVECQYEHLRPSDEPVYGYGGGKSLSAQQGGFAALLLGVVRNCQYFYWKATAPFWASSSYYSNPNSPSGIRMDARILYGGVDYQGVNRAPLVDRGFVIPHTSFSVRCIKDK